MTTMIRTAGTAIFLALAIWLWGTSTTHADPPAPSVERQNQICLMCHSHKLMVQDGETSPRVVAAVVASPFQLSAHGGRACLECHPNLSEIPHDRTLGTTAAAPSVAVSCANCHEEAAEGYREGPHGPVAELGDDRAPECVKCHGNAHYIQVVDQWPKEKQAAACAQCHAGAGTSFLGAAPGHQRPSTGFLSTPYFAGLFLMGLTAGTLAFGIVHTELEMLRWLTQRVSHWRAARTRLVR